MKTFSAYVIGCACCLIVAGCVPFGVTAGFGPATVGVTFPNGFEKVVPATTSAAVTTPVVYAPKDTPNLPAQAVVAAPSGSIVAPVIPADVPSVQVVLPKFSDASIDFLQY